MSGKIVLALLAGLFLFGCTGQQPQQAGSQPSGTEFPATPCKGMGCMMTELVSGLQPQEAWVPSGAVQRMPTEEVSIADGGTFRLEAKIISSDLFGKTQHLYGYNGMLPGPTLRVMQGSRITVEFANRIDQPTTVHWHGIRLQNAYDGVPEVTQPYVQPGQNFTYELEFPDAGIYWYHPHVREEVQQERGLYGLIIVGPRDGAEKDEAIEVPVVLDDVLASADGSLFPFQQNETNFALMGRFGNRVLVNGKESETISVATGQTVGLHFLNSANVRPFNVSVEGTQMKVVASDGGKFEREFFANSFTISPSERYSAEVAFAKAGRYGIYSTTPFYSEKLAEIIVEGPETTLPTSFLSLRNNSEVAGSIAPYRALLGAKADFHYALVPEINGASEGAAILMEHTEDGIEWEDTMFGMNLLSTNESVTWRFEDTATGKYNMDASREVSVGRPFKIRITNSEETLHPMQHPIHLHGAQFLVAEKNGVKNGNLAWKDTVLVPTGSYVDIVTYFPNPGEWMLHCHIAEHLGSGMMTSFKAA